MQNYVNMKIFWVRNLKTRINWFNLGHWDNISKTEAVPEKPGQLRMFGWQKFVLAVSEKNNLQVFFAIGF